MFWTVNRVGHEVDIELGSHSKSRRQGDCGNSTVLIEPITVFVINLLQNPRCRLAGRPANKCFVRHDLAAHHVDNRLKGECKLKTERRSGEAVLASITLVRRYVLPGRR